MSNTEDERAAKRHLSRIVPRYGGLDLLCLDELRYVALGGAPGVELLFQIITVREKRRRSPPAATSPVSEWGSFIPDPGRFILPREVGSGVRGDSCGGERLGPRTQPFSDGGVRGPAVASGLTLVSHFARV